MELRTCVFAADVAGDGQGPPSGGVDFGGDGAAHLDAPPDQRHRGAFLGKQPAAAAPIPEVAPLIQATCPASRPAAHRNMPSDRVRCYEFWTIGTVADTACTNLLPLGLEAGPIEHRGIDDSLGLSPQRQVEHALAHRPADVAKQLVGPGDAVRRQQNVVQLAEAMRRGDRLLGKTIDRRAGNADGS